MIALALMIYTDEDSFVCDMAEYYNIYDYRAHKASYIAKLAYGLRDDSRSKLAHSKYKVPLETMMIAKILDSCSFLVWSKTEDAQHGANRPESMVKILLGEDKQKTSDVMSFASPDDFEKARAQILGEV